MLSPSTRHTLSPPMNLSPMISASAIPLCTCCTSYSMCIPNWDPSPRVLLKFSRSDSLVITRMSLMPAVMRVHSG